MAVVVDVGGGSEPRSPMNSPRRVLSADSLSAITKTWPQMVERRRYSLKDDYRKYEIGVLCATQLSYFPIAATMLSTSFFEMTPETCLRIRNTVANETFDVWRETLEFNSLLYQWNSTCSNSFILTLSSTVLMLGALLGAFIAGWLADAYGRKRVVTGTLMLVCIGNLLLSLFGPISYILGVSILFLLGVGCGGYMVTNLVLLVECLEDSRSRLLAVSLNGWSFSMILVSLLARITLHWLRYHLITAVLAFIAAVCCQFLTVESCRWLASVNRLGDARTAALAVTRRNGDQPSPDATWWELLGFSPPVTNHFDMPAECKRYGYLDLIRHRSVRRPLLALCYCFVSSSIVSFGFYFTFDILPGDRYVIMIIMGSSKFALGLIPFAVSKWIGRRPIAIISVGIACVAGWSVVASQLAGVGLRHWSLAALSLMIAASLDPTWKINHLYSAELFPTVVRNMARGVCNVGARLGSVAAPLVVLLRQTHPLAQYFVFAILLSIQWVIVIVLLPETKGKPLLDDLNDSEDGAEEEATAEEADIERLETKSPTDRDRLPTRG